MKAIVFDKYGSIDNLYLEEREKPEPEADQVRLKVYAAAVNPRDIEMIKGKFNHRLSAGIFSPGKRIPGIDVAGKVDAMGPEALGCKWGQEVYADLSDVGYGGFAEYVCVPKSAIALKPQNLDFVHSAAVPLAATTALQGLLNWGDMLSYRSAMIIGAAGGVGHFAVQIAKNYNLQVTAVTREENKEMVKEIGADHVISYEEMNFSDNTRHYELIFDTAAHRPAGKYRKLLTSDGRYVACAYSPSAYLQSPFGGILHNRKIITFDSKPDTDDLATIRKMIERGSIKPRVDRIFSLEETAAALKYMTKGSSRGKVVIKIAD
jgi:NADPH:quinone reductase-like Zn-dependent oxidoreductase